MIQNIEPHVYRNEYVPEPPKEDSVILYYEGRKILVKIEDQEISFLTFKEAAVYNPDVYEEYTYLFSIDGQGYYLAEGIDPENFPGFELKDNQYFREARPKYRQFAAVTGWQLYRWYQSRKFCGHCGQPMVHDDKERMMRCPDCGMMEFPKICPAVIIAVTHGDKIMYRISKVLNHNTVIGIHADDNQEYLVMGKGIGFGKKVSERFEVRDGDTVYSLQATSNRGNAKELATSIQPIYLEIANEILDEAEKVFQNIDRAVLFPMADHLEYAVKRIQNHEQISNPLTDDIRVLFHLEYKTAECVRPILKERLGITIDDNEVGYISLHIHSAIKDENVSLAMQIARAVRECISHVEQVVNRPIDVMSLSYNRLMNHIRNMVARALQHEELKLNLNDYMEVKFPQAFQLAQTICDQVGKNLCCTISDAEVGYLAMHIERVVHEDEDLEAIEARD